MTDTLTTSLGLLAVAIAVGSLLLNVPVLVLGETHHRAKGWVDDLGWLGLEALLAISVIALIARERPAGLWLVLLIHVVTRRQSWAAYLRVRASVPSRQEA